MPGRRLHLHWWPMLLVSKSGTDPRSKSVRSFHSKWITVMLAETAALDRRPKVVPSIPSCQIPVLYVTTHLNTQTPFNECVPLRHQFSRRLNDWSAWWFSFARLGSVGMTSLLSIGVMLTIWKDASDVSYQECCYRQCSRHRRRERVGTRRPHHIGIYATPVEMVAGLGALTDRLDSPFIDLGSMVRSFASHSLNVKYYL